MLRHPTLPLLPPRPGLASNSQDPTTGLIHGLPQPLQQGHHAPCRVPRLASTQAGTPADRDLPTLPSPLLEFTAAPQTPAMGILGQGETRWIGKDRERWAPAGGISATRTRNDEALRPGSGTGLGNPARGSPHRSRHSAGRRPRAAPARTGAQRPHGAGRSPPESVAAALPRCGPRATERSGAAPARPRSPAPRDAALTPRSSAQRSPSSPSRPMARAAPIRSDPTRAAPPVPSRVEPSRAGRAADINASTRFRPGRGRRGRPSCSHRAYAPATKSPPAAPAAPGLSRAAERSQQLCGAGALPAALPHGVPGRATAGCQRAAAARLLLPG